MTTPNELYAMKPERVTQDLDHLSGCYYNHVPEIGDEFNIHKYKIKTERVEIRFIKDWCFDGRRVWQLATVWFDGKPIMVVQNAGREGDDHEQRFITDLNGFMAMCTHIKQLIDVESSEQSVTFDANEQIEKLIEFYGNRLDEHFERY